jgi:hypothetical protein
VQISVGSKISLL